MKRILLFLMIILSFSKILAQEDNRIIVGVSEFTSEDNSKFTSLVTEKIVEILTNSKRFRVVDRTSADKVKDELELQKSEAFIDSKNLVEQGVKLAAQKIITGTITKIPVYAMRSSNGNVNGYKASVAFQMKIVDVASGLSTDATSFEGKASDLMLSPESAVQQAMKSVQLEIIQYFKFNFPVQGKLIRILENDDKTKVKVLLNIGKTNGVNIGDRFTIDKVELIEGQKYPQKIGEVEVKNLAGENLSEAFSVDKKSGENIISNFSKEKTLDCTLIIKK
ncbi:CsgG/HfaB family protein [Halpernia frigidisoli]|uniref:Peptidoglycan-synthase activator LpoB n=1 Tax=Halpernia frigidisoli TaxID=1125876 RepID=A0A1I3IU06_9FLAO|nr:CsgG/HfaB family protein [Halpernia frigidisoli]SFI51429.1 Peptidoglycan-synthase activator LpoB [Halpernia frigidisoli]